MKKSVVTLFLLMMLALPMTAMAAGCSCDDYEMAGGYTYYGQYTSDEHWETYYMTFVCTTCGDTYSMMWNRDTFAHKFSGSECTECGYTRGQTTSCSHMGVYGQGELRDVYESKSSTQHVMIKYRDMICTRCGEWFSEETYRTTKTHLFSGNKCTLCDYTRSGGSSTSSCSHSNHSSKGFGDIVYTPISGGNEHSIERHYKITCKDCGKVITSDYTGRTTESHNFNSAGKCTKCGYSRTDSGNVTATSKPTTQTAGYYIQSTVSFLDGRTTIQWEDSNNNGPYRVQIYQINIEDAELNLYNGKTNDRKITTEKLIPGNKYRVVVTDAKGHETSKYIYIAKGTRFVNGKMNLR